MKKKRKRLGGRGRTLSGRAVQSFLWESVKQGAIMQELSRLEKRTGIVHQRDLHKALTKFGMIQKDILKYTGALLRMGHIYEPRPFYLKTTKSTLEEK